MLTPEDAVAIAAAYGLGERAELIGPVAAGKVGQVWRLTSSTGTYAVKDPIHFFERDEAERDGDYQDRVRAAGVPMPPVVRATTGRVVADVRDQPVRVYGWVDVLAPTRDLDPAAVGRMLAAIHSVEVPTDAGVEDWFCAPVGPDAWADLVERLHTAGAPFADRLAAQVPTMLEVETVCTPPSRARLCHRDLWSDNVLRTPDDGLVVLDWENSGPGDPVGEVGMVLYEFGLGDPARMATLLASYDEAGGAFRLGSRADLTMLVADLHHIVEVGCERWLRATGDADRRENEDWVAEYLDDPLTLDVLDALLDAARRG